MKKRTLKKLTLNKESIIRLDPSELREIAGGVTMNTMCTGTLYCTQSCRNCTIETCFC